MNKMLYAWLLTACCGLPAAYAGDSVDVLAQPALRGPQALRAVLQDVARAGTRLVSVGERGVVLLSDDNGASWRQAKAVPVSVTLTAVQFVDARNGWTVGHAGVVLHSEDGGEHWTLQLDGKRAGALELQA
ncbi:YCF48-related protein, partial [Pseudomonas putida]|uniref:WD40/YVTN/BNR-like repeat-containing protein n=1 Tax=Pseudomonas putida TaxID=303 RepID=UPI0034D61ECA